MTGPTGFASFARVDKIVLSSQMYDSKGTFQTQVDPYVEDFLDRIIEIHWPAATGPTGDTGATGATGTTGASGSSGSTGP